MALNFSKTKAMLGKKPLMLTWVITGLVSLVMVFSYYGFFRPSLISIGHRITTLHLEIAENSKNKIEGFIDENISALDQLAQALSVLTNEQQKKIIIGKFIKEKNWFNEIAIIDKYGQENLKISQFEVYYPEDYLNVLNYEFFIEANQGKIFLSRVHTTDKAIPIITISMPIKNPSDEKIGILAAQLSLREIWEMVGEMEVGNTGQVYVVDSLGYIIAHRDTSLVLKKINVAKRKAVSKVITEKTTVLGLDAEEEYFNEQGVKVYVVGLPLGRTGWGVFVEEPIKDAWASYKKIRATGLLLGFVTLILLLILMINARVLNVLFVDLRKGRELLTAEVEKRTSELKELDRTTKLLVKRDLELSVTNRELDKKIEQLEKSEKSLLRAFGDIRTAQKELEEEKDKTEAVINNFIDPIIVLDENKKIILFNPACRRIFGLAEDSLGQEVNDKDNFSMENFKNIIDKKFKVKALEDIEAENVTIEEVEVKFGDHDITYKVITARVLSDREEYLGIMKIFYDVTREKTLDKLKSEFISIAAHQLRTPLSAIKWVMKMVLDEDVGKLNKEQTELMEKGYKSNERIIRLVNDLLNVSRIEEGRFGYTFEKQDFNKAIDAVIEWSESMIAKSKIKFKINKPKKLPLVVYDKEKMNLVMQNLFDNAIKYTPEFGTIEINVEAVGKFLRVAVKDNGVGIPEKDKQKIFSKFFRAVNVVRLQTEGSGLGLFIVKNIIEKHGGTISIDSKEGVGTEVSFKIPLTA